MADNVLKEFLVALGFKVDQDSLKKFNTGVAHATGSVLRLAAATTAAVAAVEIAVNKIGVAFENLYYESQRTDSTVASLNAIGFAAGQVGLSATAGVNAVEGMASAFRNNPFLIGLFSQLTGRNETGRSGTQRLNDFINSPIIAKLPQFLQLRYASEFGIDPTTFLNLFNNRKQNAAEQGFGDKVYGAFGVDQTGLGTSETAISRRLGEQALVFKAIAASIEQRLLPAANKLLDWAEAAENWFARLDKRTHGLASGVVAVAAAVLTALPIISSLTTVMRLLGLTLLANPLVLTLLGAAVAGVAVGAGIGWLQDHSDRVKAVFSDLTSWLTNKYNVFANSKVGRWLGLKPVDTSGAPTTPVHQLGSEALALLGGAFNPSAPGGGGADSGARPINNPGNLRPVGGSGFRHFGSIFEGTQALAHQLLLYGTRGWNTVASIISHWAPASDHNNTAAYIAAVVRDIGGTAGQVRNLLDPDTLAKITAAIIKHEGDRLNVSGSLISSASGAALRSLTINHKTEITVHGTDPQATGKAVATEVGRVHGNTVRQTRGAIDGSYHGVTAAA